MTRPPPDDHHATDTVEVVHTADHTGGFARTVEGAADMNDVAVDTAIAYRPEERPYLLQDILLVDWLGTLHHPSLHADPCVVHMVPENHMLHIRLVVDRMELHMGPAGLRRCRACWVLALGSQ